MQPRAACNGLMPPVCQSLSATPCAAAMGAFGRIKFLPFSRRLLHIPSSHAPCGTAVQCTHMLVAGSWLTRSGSLTQTCRHLPSPSSHKPTRCSLQLIAMEQ